jgi:hypothetical protein
MSAIDENFAACQEALTSFYRVIEDLDETDLDSLAESVLAVDSLRDNLSALRSLAESNLVNGMGELPEFSVPGAIMEVRRADSRKAWAHKEIAAKVAKNLVQASVDFETGEMLKSTEDLIQEVIEYAGVSYWKVGALTRLGITADEFCEVTEGGMKVRIRRV